MADPVGNNRRVHALERLLDRLGPDSGEVAVAAPGSGPGFWAGGPSAVHADGAYWLAYRLRRPVDQGRGYANVVARSEDGVHFTTVATVTSDQFACASLERPALVRRPAGGWRLYVSCSTENSKHWWVEALDAERVEDLPGGARTVVLPGDAATAWKDVVVSCADGEWHIWACRHPLDDGDDEADRMTSWFGTSADGLTWTMAGPALTPTAGSWDARGTRITSVLHRAGSWAAFYDGRASAAENWHERTGLALGSGPDDFHAGPGPTPPGPTTRYVSVVERPTEYRVYWESSRPDGAHDLRTANVPRPASESQSA
jgi:hypothetical protein